MVDRFLNLDQDFLRAFTSKWNISEIFVYGSVSTGLANSDSDIDLLVSFIPGSSWSLFDLIVMEEELSKKLNKPVDLTTLAAIQSSKNSIIREKILREAKQIYVS